MHQSGMEDMILYIASQEVERAALCMHIMEIISLMFKEQVDPVFYFWPRWPPKILDCRNEIQFFDIFASWLLENDTIKRN